MGADFDNVPIIEVNSDNFKELWPSLKLSIDMSVFVAVDCELSGLGDRKKLNEKEIEERYKNVCEIAKSRSVISLGISCFQTSVKANRAMNSSCTNVQNCNSFIVQTYNIIILCSENYVVEPNALKFLVSHGFDFERQYSKGVPYYRGNDKEGELYESPTLRSLMAHLITSKKPVIFHNGFVDLLFLYQSFYAELPLKLQSFIADLALLFPNGIFDTKYLADFVFGFTTSFLQYLFRKVQLENIAKQKKGEVHASINFPIYPNCYYIESVACGVDFEGQNVNVCENFANHGWCQQGDLCKLSHNIDDVLLWEKKRKKKSRKRSFHSMTESKDITEKIQVSTRSTGHRAGFDAFMTGFIFVCFLNEKFSKFDTSEINWDCLEFANFIYLCGKTYPLMIKKSNFCKQSKVCLLKHGKLLLNKL